MTERLKLSTRKSIPLRSTRSLHSHSSLTIKNNKVEDDFEDPHEMGDNNNNNNPLNVTRTDLRKEYNRYCKLYSSEPLDIVAGPLEKASYRMDSSIELNLKGRGLRGVDCLALGKILANNSSIYHLNLNDCLLLPQGFSALLDGISRNTYMTILELRGNNIQSNMVENISMLLKQNHTIKNIFLEWNCLGVSQLPIFQSFCDSLAMNRGLETLDLRNNQIGDNFAMDVASALKDNNTLRSLDLRWNSIGVKGAKALWDVLQYNKTITEIQLTGNFVPEEIVSHMKTTLHERLEQETSSSAETQVDLSARTELLTRQLKKTEDNYESEIQNMVSLFENGEQDFKKIIQDGQDEVMRLTQSLIELRDENKIIREELWGLKELQSKQLETIERLKGHNKELELENEALKKECSQKEELIVPKEQEQEQSPPPPPEPEEQLVDSSTIVCLEMSDKIGGLIDKLKELQNDQIIKLEGIKLQNNDLEIENKSLREQLKKRQDDEDSNCQLLDNVDNVCIELCKKIQELVNVKEKFCTEMSSRLKKNQNETKECDNQ